MRGAPRKEKRCQEPFRYASSLARNRYGQHGGPWSVNTRAWWHARAGQNRDRAGGALGRVLPNKSYSRLTLGILRPFVVSRKTPHFCDFVLRGSSPLNRGEVRLQ